ncbi:UDP-N-acetylmuramate dehydrogenase [Nesterenkonia sandarakina]
MGKTVYGVGQANTTLQMAWEANAPPEFQIGLIDRLTYMTTPTSLADSLLRRLRQAVPGGVQVSVNLSSFSRWRIGGPADALVEPTNRHEVAGVLQLLESTGTPYCVVGETSNLLFDSRGLRGVIVRIAARMSGISFDGRDVVVKAGTSVPELARAAGAKGLSGIEHTVGIPGTLGGLVIMNGGSQRKGIGSSVAWVRYVDRVGTLIELSREDCEFSYRSSALQRLGGVVTEVGLRLDRGNTDEIEAEMDEIVASRQARFPEDAPNCGSTFLSNPAMYSSVGPPGKAIDDAGLRGTQIGGAQISPKHSNFINNVGGATSDDVLALVGLVRGAVLERTGFRMDAEARYVSPDGKVTAAHTVSDDRAASPGTSMTPIHPK